MSCNRQIRGLVGHAVRVRTDRATIDAVLLSWTHTSVWLLAGDEDVLVDCAHVVDVTARP